MNTIIEKCPDCFKPVSLCFCKQPKTFSSKVQVVLLQHPQEPKELLSTAPLVKALLPDAKVTIGLSWPNFRKAVGDPLAIPSQWAVVYLGSGIKSAPGKEKMSGVVFVDKKGMPKGKRDQEILAKQLKGIIFLDGTWTQAKTLWWRNAWLLKLNSIILLPPHVSMYGKLRKEPRKECLSTLESVATILDFFGNAEAATGLEHLFGQFIEKFKSLR